MPLTAGTRLGPYQVESAIGKGGMGEVYRAKDTRLDRTVAIKVLPPHLAADPDFRERFEREAKSISSLNHPNICTLYDVGREGGIEYLVLEHLEGESLADRLAKGPLPLAAALKISIEIASALDRAHSQGIVHRDLKPGNVMLTGTGAKLLDFGLAKMGTAMPRPGSSSGAPSTSLPTVAAPLTTQGTILGTFQYMSPEQIEGADAGPRADIWALGCVIFEMVTGRRAFDGKSQAVLMAAIATAEPDPLSPPALEHVVRRCLAKDAEGRWQTAHDLLIQLRWIAGGNADAGPAAVSAAKTQKLTKMVLVAAGLLFAVLAYPAAMYFRGPADTGAFQFRVRMRGLSTPDIALSPDGRTMAMVARPDTSEPASLYTRRVRDVTFQKLGGTEEASQPFFSPDGRYIAFLAKNRLKRVSVSGGAPQEIAEAPGFSGGTWNRDGVILYGSVKGVYRVSAEGGTPVLVTTPSLPETGHLWPKFLPDGHHFLYLAWSGDAPGRAVFVGDIGSKSGKRLMAAESNAIYAEPGYVIFHRAASLFAQPFDAGKLAFKGEPVHLADQLASGGGGRGHFDASQAGVLLYYQGSDTTSGRANTQPNVQLGWVNPSGETVAYAGEPGPYGDMDVSPDGKLVAVTQQASGSVSADVWVIDWQRAGVTTRLTLDPADDLGPVWSPDGQRIAFTTYRKGNADIYVKNANGVGPEAPLLESSVDEIVKDWSKDGRYIAYTYGEDDFRDIYAMPLEDGKPATDAKPFPVVQGHFHKDQPLFSYDGKWLAYTSDETGTYQIYVVSFPKLDQKLQVSVSGGGQPHWRKDGKELYFRDPVNGGVMVADIQAGAKLDASPPHKLFQPGFSGAWIRDPIRHLMAVTPDGQRFLSRVAEARTGSVASGAAGVLDALRYMAPEQLEGLAADARTDIFAFGLLLHEMLTGKKTFDGKSRMLLISAITTADPEPISRTQPAVPAAVDHIVQVCLAKDPNDRWQTARDLLAELRWIAEAGGSSVTGGVMAGLAAAQRKPGWLKHAPVAVAALLVSAVALPAALYYRGSGSEEFRFQVPTSSGAGLTPVGIVRRVGRDSAISPDGRDIAYVTQSGAPATDPPALYVLRLGSVAPRRLPGTEEASQPFWSPDGRFIGYVAGRKLKKLEASGGPPQEICDADDFSGGTWNSQGTILFGSGKGLFRVSAEGGKPESVTSLEAGETGHFWPHFLPDGRHFLFTVWAGEAARRAVLVGTLGSKERARVMAAESNALYAAPGYLLFHRENALYAQPFDWKKPALAGEPVRVANGVDSFGVNGYGDFSVAADGLLLYFGETDDPRVGRGSVTGDATEWRLAWADRTATVVATQGPDGPYVGFEVSPDGKRIAVHRHEDVGGDILVIEPDNSIKKLTFDASHHNSSPVWSPKGDRIAYSALEKGKWGIYQTLSNGSGAEELLYESEFRKAPMSWSPDGKSIVFWVDDPKSGGDLWVLAVEERKAQPLLATSFNETHAQISPDGRWIAYTSNLTGRNEIHVQPFPTGSGHWQVSFHGGDWPRWRGDSKELFYHAIAGAPDSAAVSTPFVGNLFSVTVTASGSEFVPGNPKEVVRSLASNLPHSSGDYQTYAVSQDGRRILSLQFAGGGGGAGGRAGATYGPDPGGEFVVARNWAKK